MSGTPVSLSLIVPAYNEAARIARPLGEMGAYLGAQAFSSEIVVVDDGSRDRTAPIVREVAARLPVPVRLIQYDRNRGKGYALKVGFASARGERLLFTDCDLATPLSETGRLLAALDAGYDFAIGSRKMEGAEITVHQPWLRESMGRVFTGIVRILIADVSDVTCGFKAFRGDVGRDIFSRIRVDDWSFDAELLLIAKRLGYRLQEVPVRWEDQAGTKVNLFRDVVNSLVGLGRIRANALLGRYAAPCDIGPTHEEACVPARQPGDAISGLS